MVIGMTIVCGVNDVLDPNKVNIWPTFLLLDCIKVNMANRIDKSITGHNDHVYDESGPLVLDSVYIQTYPTHCESLGIELVMPISMVLMRWTQRTERTLSDSLSARKSLSKSFGGMDGKYVTDSVAARMSLVIKECL
jgi:hypothetical protein